jgi:glycosyltransferase involved in cell wall biosynthesis
VGASVTDLDTRRSAPIDLEVIIPIYNEELVLERLFSELSRVFSEEVCSREGISSFRILLVDDGSRDESARIVGNRIAGGFPATLLRLSRNFGHQAALSAGLHHCRASVVAIMDADLQDPPEVILEMLAAWRSGADVAYGVRENRKEGPLKRLAYAMFYRIYSFLAEVEVPLDSGDFSLLDRRVIEAMNALPETLRFPRGLRTWVGFKQVPIPYERQARREGESKYDWRRLYHLATDGIASMSIRPLRIVQFSSFVSAIVTLILGGGLMGRVLIGSDFDPVAYWALITCLAVVATSSINLACLYVFSAYIGRTYLEMKGRPTYVVMEVVAGQEEPGS